MVSSSDVTLKDLPALEYMQFLLTWRLKGYWEEVTKGIERSLLTVQNNVRSRAPLALSEVLRVDHFCNKIISHGACHLVKKDVETRV